MSTYRQMTERLGGRYGLPVVQAKEEIQGDPSSEDYWKAIYNRAVDLADWCQS